MFAWCFLLCVLVNICLGGGGPRNDVHLTSTTTISILVEDNRPRTLPAALIIAVVTSLSLSHHQARLNFISHFPILCIY